MHRISPRGSDPRRSLGRHWANRSRPASCSPSSLGAPTPTCREIYVAIIPAMVRAALDLEDPGLARRLVDRIEPRSPYAEHAIVAANAALTEARGDLQAAADAYADAAGRWERFGVVPEQAFALLGQGPVSARAVPADRGRSGPAAGSRDLRPAAEPPRARRDRRAPRTGDGAQFVGSPGYSARSTSSARSCSTARWHSWMCAVIVEGTRIATSASGASGAARLLRSARPPERSCDRACSAARTMFAEFPLVEIAMSTSPARPSDSTWRAKTPSMPKSFAIAVSSDVSVVRAIAGIDGTRVVDGERAHELGRQVLGVGGAAAVAADQQLPAGRRVTRSAGPPRARRRRGTRPRRSRTVSAVSRRYVAAISR